MTLGQRVAVLRDGRVQQVDTPQRLYTLPANVFVASFIGSPAMNLVVANLTEDGVEVGGHRIPLPREHRPAAAPGPIALGIRPESFEDGEVADPSLPRLHVDVAVLEELGSDTHVIFPVAADRVHAGDERQPDDDAQTLIAADGTAFNARVTAATRARAGRPLELAVNPAGFHYFDVSSGENLRRAPAERRRRCPPSTCPTRRSTTTTASPARRSRTDPGTRRRQRQRRRWRCLAPSPACRWSGRRRGSRYAEWRHDLSWRLVHTSHGRRPGPACGSEPLAEVVSLAPTCH